MANILLSKTIHHFQFSPILILQPLIQESFIQTEISKTLQQHLLLMVFDVGSG